jgi:hypothetical protein
MKLSFMPAMQLAPKANTSSKQVETAENDVPRETPVDETPATPAELPNFKPKPTSPKLDELNATQLALQTDVASGKYAPGSTEFVDAMVALFKVGNDIKAEEANILRIAKEQEIAAKRNERIGLVDAAFEAHAALIAINATEASIEEKNEVYAKFKEARAVIDNEMLLRVPSGIASKKAVDGLAPKATTEGGEKGKAILDYFISRNAEGVPTAQIKKELVEQGHAVGTVGSVILAYERKMGWK